MRPMPMRPFRNIRRAPLLFERWLGVAIVIVLLCFPTGARAAVVEAPIGGNPLDLPQDRVLCGTPPDGWTVDSNRRRMHTPAAGTPGLSVTVLVAQNATACAGAPTEKVTLVAVGNLPTFDVASITVEIDSGRLEAHGDGLEGVRIAWRAEGKTGSDVCLNVTKDKGHDLCAINIDRSLPADPRRLSLHFIPARGRDGPDVVMFDRTGTALADDQFRLPIARIVIDRLFPDSHTVDLASGEGRVDLTHPEAVSSADCGAARCNATETGLVVRGVPATITSITTKLRLLPRVFLRRGDTMDNVPSDSLSVLRCPLSMVSGEPLRDVDDLSVLMKLDKSCASGVDQLRWSAAGEPASVVRTENAPDAVYVLLWVGHVENDRLTIVASRADDGSVVAVDTEHTWQAPPLRTSLTLPTFGEIEFIPKNRDAILSVSPAPRIGRIVPISVPGAYTATEEKDGFHIRGEFTSGGYTALRFAYRFPGLPDSFSTTNLATLDDPVQRPIKEANIPAPLGASSVTKFPIVELSCILSNGKLFTIAPGTAPHIPFAERDSCRLVIHRDRIPESSGEQRIDIDVSVTTSGGADRPEAKLTQHFLLRHGNDHDIIWIRGAKEQFDHINVHVTQVIDESQYIGGAGRTDIPSSQWTVVTEDANFKFYATAAIPASLYRFSKDPQDLGTGTLTVNFGVLSRLTWLDSNGKEGLLGLEAGVMAMGLATDKDRQLAIVAGPGFSIPLGNINQPSQAAVNIHAWVSYTIGKREGDLVNPVTGAVEGTAVLNHWAFVFGPSITIGNIGTFL